MKLQLGLIALSLALAPMASYADTACRDFSGSFRFPSGSASLEIIIIQFGCERIERTTYSVRGTSSRLLGTDVLVLDGKFHMVPLSTTDMTKYYYDGDKLYLQLAKKVRVGDKEVLNEGGRTEWSFLPDGKMRIVNWTLNTAGNVYTQSAEAIGTRL